MPAPSYRDYQLPSGRHGLSPAQVAGNQRLRLIGAAAEVLAEDGLIGLSSRLIARRAGVSSHTFYEHFKSVDALLIASFANATRVLGELIAEACGRATDGDGQTKKALTAAFSLALEEPGLTALMRVAVAVAVPEIGAERERLIARLDGLARKPGTAAHKSLAIAAVLALAVDRLELQASGAADSIAEELAALLD